MAVFTPEFIAKCRRFMEARELRDETAEAAKSAEAAYRELEGEVWHELAADYDPNDPNSKLTSQKVPLGDPWGTISLGPKETMYGRIYDDERALEWVEKRAMVDEMTAPRFVKKRINEEVRTLHESGESMPPGIDYYLQRYISITKPKT